MNIYIINQICATILIVTVIAAWLLTLTLTNNNPMAHYTLLLLFLTKKYKYKEKDINVILQKIADIEQKIIELRG